MFSLYFIYVDRNAFTTYIFRGMHTVYIMEIHIHTPTTTTAIQCKNINTQTNRTLHSSQKMKCMMLVDKVVRRLLRPHDLFLKMLIGIGTRLPNIARLSRFKSLIEEKKTAK